MNSTPKSFDEWLAAATAGLDRNIRQRLELELSAHYEDAFQDFIDAGLPPDEAVRRALKNLGDVGAARELFRDEYAAEMPWDCDFLPKKGDAEYGYVKGTQLVGSTREGLIELCKGAGINSTEVTLVWTPETDHIMPVESVPFLFKAIKEKRKKSAQWELLMACLPAVVLGLEFRDGKISELRHLTMLIGLFAVVPGISGIRNLRAAEVLTPEILAKEVAETPRFHLWTGLQRAHLTIGLAIICSIVTILEIVAIAFDGSFENAALVKSATQAGEWWRLFTCIFVHAGVQHLIFNAIGLSVFGQLVEVAIARMFLPIVFLLSALSGSVFSLFLIDQTSVGASGGVLGLAGFLFASSGQRKGVPLPGVQQTVASVACFAAVGGVIAYDLLDSAAHLGGLLAGLAIGGLVKDPKKLSSTRAFRLAGIASSAVLLGGAVLAVVLMMRPVPRTPSNDLPAAQKKVSPSAQPKDGSSQKPSPAPAKQRAWIYLPARDPVTPASCIDLSPYKNGDLMFSWQAPAYAVTLGDVPTGLQALNGVSFDIHCLIQLRSANALTNFPKEVCGIKVAQAAQQIHFLHATGESAPDGMIIGKYVVHFRSGTEIEIPIVYGEHLREWHAGKDSGTMISKGEMAWNIQKCHQTRLFHSIWTNPFPTEIVESLTFNSALTECFPFLVAVTVEPWSGSEELKDDSNERGHAHARYRLESRAR